MTPPIPLWLLLGLSVFTYRACLPRAASTAEDNSPQVTSTRRPLTIAVFAPHPDDEVLGVGGALRQAVEDHDNVFVFIMTNGDGNYGNCKVVMGHQCSAQELMDYGRRRQDESRDALSRLGVASNHINFLGYPDRLLGPMFRAFASDTCEPLPSESVPTRMTRTYGRNLLGDSTNVDCCAVNVLADIRAALSTLAPDIVYTTDIQDTNPDHEGTAHFVLSALTELARRPSHWKMSATEVRTVLIHYRRLCRGIEQDWYPYPHGEHPDINLLEESYRGEPSGVDARDCVYDHMGRPSGMLRLSPHQKTAKRAAILSYRTQFASDDGYLLAFARNNEEWWTRFGRDLASPPGDYLQIAASGPVELSVVDPSGRKMDVLESEIPGGAYLKVHTDGGIGLDRLVLIPQPLPGIYAISTTPVVDSVPAGRFSISASCRGRQSWLARGVNLRTAASGRYSFSIQP